jgi:ABC transport system ATP-binding/permease protein
MPPERFDWSDRQPPQAGPPQAGLAPAGLAEGAPPQSLSPGAASSVTPDLAVLSRRSVHEFQAGNTYQIGRDPQSDIVLTDSRVSWQHAVLRVDGNAWVLEDLGSTNGTFLGPQRSDRIEISSECVVRLGNSDDGPILRCTPHAPAGQAAAHPAGQAAPAPAEPARPRHAARATPGSAPPAAASPAPSAGQRHDSESWWQPTPDPEPALPAEGYSPRPPAPSPYPPASPQPYPAASPQPYPAAEPVPSVQPFPAPDPFRSAE